MSRNENVISREKSPDISRVKKVFTRNYDKLRGQLPAIIEELLAYFVANEVITFVQEEEIMSQATYASKVRTALVPIHTALCEGIFIPLQQLIRFMLVSNHRGCVALANEINLELKLVSYEDTDLDMSGEMSGESQYPFVHTIFMYA